MAIGNEHKHVGTVIAALGAIALIAIGAFAAWFTGEYDWWRASSDGSKESLARFVTRFPNNWHAEEAMRRIDGQLKQADEDARQRALLAGTAESYRAYLAGFPAGHYSEQAAKKIGTPETPAQLSPSFDDVPPELALIHACSGPSPTTYDAIAMVRAVNHLHSLGKERAIELLRRYVLIAPQQPPWFDDSPQPGLSASGDSACVMLIVRLLFEPDPLAKGSSDANGELHLGTVEAGQLGYPLIFSRMMVAWPPRGATNVEGYPFRVVGDVPFLVADWLDFRTGHDSEPLSHLMWAERYARLRQKPLQPVDDPTTAAESLLNSGSLLPKNDPRRQIWLGLQDAVGVACPSEHEFVRDAVSGRDADFGVKAITDADWSRFARAARAANLRWDSPRQEYVARNAKH